jgi:hypothetical protein
MMSMIGPFWSLATSFLSGTGAAGGIALINTIANTGGMLSPYLMGKMKTATGSFSAGQFMLSLIMLIGAGLALCVRHDPRADRAEPRDPESSGGSNDVGHVVGPTEGLSSVGRHEVTRQRG